MEKCPGSCVIYERVCAHSDSREVTIRSCVKCEFLLTLALKCNKSFFIFFICLQSLSIVGLPKI